MRDTTVTMLNTVLLAGLLLLPATVSTSDTTCDADGNRIDCGYAGMAQQECEEKGCCWQPAEFAGAPHVDMPWCFRPNAEPSEYTVTDLEQSKGGNAKSSLKISRRTQPYLGPDVEALTLEAEPLSNSVLRLRLTDAAAQRWEVPRWLLASELLPGGLGSAPSTGGGGGRMKESATTQAQAAGAASAPSGSPLFELNIKYEPFSLEVTRPSEAQGAASRGPPARRAVFNTTGTRLVFKDQYLELTTWVDPSVVLYGAGERASQTLHLKRNGMPRTLWNHDLGPTFPEQNMYGSHPFVLALEPDGTAWGMLLLNSNAMDIVPSEHRLSWRVTGGMLDLFLLMGPTPLAVLDQLTAVVGRPAMMPYWSLGWHQCKYGYRSVWEVEEVVANYSQAGLPLEAIWTDIDHMDGWRDFTFHQQYFPLPEMQRFVADLHSKGQRWMPIVDPGIKVDPGYPAYDAGMREDVFMRDVDGQPYLGWVWPGASHFPDFFSSRGRAYFERQLEQHHGMVPWDGIWIDMNEVSNFCTGDICQLHSGAPHTPLQAPSRAQLRDDPPWVCHLDCHEAQALNDTQRGWLHPPYDVSSSLQRLPLGTKAMSVLATHHDGSVQYNTHQLYGLSAVLAISQAVRSIAGKRPFVLTRSSFLGTGAYAAHWTGDNSATWEQMRASIPGVMSIGLWGIPMAGADICGFQGEPSWELCARWAAMGAFYPFSRDHSDLHGGYQELYRWPQVTAVGKAALGLRYRLLPYLYTQMHTAHKTGAPVMRPLFLNFPEDTKTHLVDRQFMVGDALLASPVLDAGAVEVDAYFPAGTWHSLWKTGDVIVAGEGGTTQRISAPVAGDGCIPLHMRGGSALVMQREALTTSEVKRSPLTLVLALPGVLHSRSVASDEAAFGGGETHISTHMYNDGGEELEVGESLCNFLHIAATFSMQPSGLGTTAQVLLQFGSTSQLHHGNGSASGEGVCGPASDVDVAAAVGDSLQWPPLDGIEVLGWHLPAEAVSVEVVQRTNTCGGLEVVQALAVPAGVVGAGPSGLHLHLSSLAHQLECPYGLRVSWQSSTSVAAA